MRFLERDCFLSMHGYRVGSSVLYRSRDEVADSTEDTSHRRHQGSHADRHRPVDAVTEEGGEDEHRHEADALDADQEVCLVRHHVVAAREGRYDVITVLYQYAVQKVDRGEAGGEEEDVVATPQVLHEGYKYHMI